MLEMIIACVVFCIYFIFMIVCIYKEIKENKND